MPEFNHPDLSGLRVLVITEDGPTSQIHRPVHSCDILATCFETSELNLQQAAKRLRQQSFDLAVIEISTALDPFQCIPLLQELGSENMAIVVLGMDTDAKDEADFLAADVDGFVDLTRTTMEQIQWTIVRAVERRKLLTESQRSLSQQAQRRQQDALAAVHHVRAMRGVLLDSSCDARPPDWLVKKFDEVLRAYVVSAADDWTDEISQLVAGFTNCGVTLCDALMAHSLATEELLLSQGQRPGRRISERSQILAYAIVVQFQTRWLFEHSQRDPSVLPQQNQATVA